jgi:hypothetical protein
VIFEEYEGLVAQAKLLENPVTTAIAEVAHGFAALIEAHASADDSALAEVVRRVDLELAHGPKLGGRERFWLLQLLGLIARRKNDTQVQQKHLGRALLIEEVPPGDKIDAAKLFFAEAEDEATKPLFKQVYAHLAASNALSGGDPNLKRILSAASQVIR